ncbi:Uncharacterised protein [Candidatus Bilamarchaeum dharawalense]|uniref:Uncharacterized protein n=1 Tax=Candidatus Bilamarchaeum dharawalense TaxID=2885759 RepID=A0A5E4LQI2_9ARCH|nr:Uncharacterised protein [Candidatus Bilamarchaeum dharawalense]
MKDIFEFSSGGTFHPEGFGSWFFRLEDRVVTISHNIKGQIKNYGEFYLDESDSDKIWNLIDNANFKQSTRSGQPDEPKYLFAIKNQKMEIWSGDARDDEKLVSLIDHLTVLIEKYTKKKPVLW